MPGRQLVLDLGGQLGGPAAGGDVERGEVFTRRWVVEFILDLARYGPERDLGAMTAIEPACGEGAFLGPMIDRLIASCLSHRRSLVDLAGALKAFDLSPGNVEQSRKLAVARLMDAGLGFTEAERLATSWISVNDFLLCDVDDGRVDFVVGNPPYIRLENISRDLSAAYRTACPTMRGRSDVYVGFIERGLRALATNGTLGFIVADRWMHNDYGSALRQLVAAQYSVEAVVEMHDVDAFEDSVSAYPAVTIVRRAPQGRAVLASTNEAFGPNEAASLRQWTLGGRARLQRNSMQAARLANWFPGNELWPSGDPVQLATIKELEANFAPLQDPRTGTRVGIGVATGADSVYITRDASLVEEDRLLPLLMAPDTVSGNVDWSGTLLVSPWLDGRLVDLEDYPKLAAYLLSHEEVLRGRHVGKRQPRAWYRTIDKVDPALLDRPKLVLPDIKAASHPVLDEGRFYPHHNMYFVVSSSWDLEVLGGLLMSQVADLFVGAYCVKMRGGCYRFQAQYLRRIRVPDPKSVTPARRRALVRAFRSRDTEAATAEALQAYGLTSLPSLR